MNRLKTKQLTLSWYSAPHSLAKSYSLPSILGSSDSELPPVPDSRLQRAQHSPPHSFSHDSRSLAAPSDQEVSPTQLCGSFPDILPFQQPESILSFWFFHFILFTLSKVSLAVVVSGWHLLANVCQAQLYYHAHRGMKKQRPREVLEMVNSKATVGILVSASKDSATLPPYSLLSMSASSWEYRQACVFFLPLCLRPDRYSKCIYWIEPNYIRGKKKDDTTSPSSY